MDDPLGFAIVLAATFAIVDLVSWLIEGGAKLVLESPIAFWIFVFVISFVVTWTTWRP